MQEETEARPAWRLRLEYALYFVGWVAFSALAVHILLRSRPLIVIFGFRIVNHWARAAVDKLSFFLLGFVCLGLIILVEDYFRSAVPRNLLPRRLAIVFGIEIAILLGIYALQAVVT